MAIGIATLSIILSNKNKDNNNQNDGTGATLKPQDPNGKKPGNKVEEIVQDMEQDPAIPELSPEAVARVVDQATEEQRPYQHRGLKKEEFRKLPKVIRKKPKKKQAELNAAAAADSAVTATALEKTGCCGGKNKPAGDTSTGCCGGKHKPAAEDSVPAVNGCSSGNGCACSSSSGLTAPVLNKIDPMLLPYLVEPIKIFYSTITGTAKLFAQQLADSAVSRGLPEPKLIDIVDYDTEDFLSESSLSIFILSTYNVEGPNDWFLKWLEDTRFDWRVEKGALSKLKFSVFGLGDSAYTEEFCNGPRSADKWLGQMGAQRVWPFGEGDKNGGNAYVFFLGIQDLNDVCAYDRTFTNSTAYLCESYY
jgi:tRNA wybutosine-synthesizing protein 1